METKGILSFFVNRNLLDAIPEFLEHSSYDELIEINLDNDSYRFIYNIEEKYFSPVTEGAYRSFYEEAAKYLVHPEDSVRYAEIMDPGTLRDRLGKSELPGTLEFQFRAKNLEGQWKWVDSVVVGGAVFGLPDGVLHCYIFDIQQIKDRESGKTKVDRGKKIALDSLTGLPTNRDFFNAAEKLLKETTVDWMMIVIDLEQFKLFNEWYGFETGNKVLARIGAGLSKDAEHCNGLAGYMGNDDFCLMIPVGKLHPEILFKHIRNVLDRYGASFSFLPALGVACAQGADSVMRLHDKAEMAIANAKGNFKNRIWYFDEAMYNKLENDYKTLAAFQNALGNGEITFFLHPQCDAETGKIVGAEALARWIRKDGSMVMPGDFVPALENYGFIPDLDKFIWDEVAKWCKGCIDKEYPLLPVSVNVSAIDIFTFDVPQYFASLVRQYRIPKHALKIEITESACGEDSDSVRAAVHALRSNGFVVLMDDFGSGYSSLNMLHELNIDVIKMDARFLQIDNASLEKGLHILESVVYMAKSMGLPTIVEGVETREQKEYLMSLGCQYIQGFYYYRPMPVTEFEALIQDRHNVDLGGFRAKANEEFRMREFLNDTVYSDAMLNNILGPAAIYEWHGEDVDIVRFNQKFYETVDVEDFHQRLNAIQRFMPPADAVAMFQALRKAVGDRMNGASEVMTFSRLDGSFVKFLIHFYLLEDTKEVKRFYGSARDVTEISDLSNHMKLLSKYLSDCVILLIYRHGRVSFQVAAQGLEKEMGLTREKMEAELNSGRFFYRIGKDDRDRITAEIKRSIENRQNYSAQFDMAGAEGKILSLYLKSDFVDEQTSDVKSIISIECRQE